MVRVRRRGARESAGEASVILVVVPSDPPTERAAQRRATPDEDSTRRRAGAIAGHRADEAGARLALGSPDGKTAAAGLAALVRMGAVSGDDLARALAAPATGLRRRAAELAASAAPADRRLDARLALALGDEDPLVVEAACFALGERHEGMDTAPVPDVVARLSAVSAGHADAYVREAAVAALGAMGDPGGLPAVLAALTDRPTVRRRAAVALAAFDDDEAEAALRRCLEDRDWQVRSVAETLLDLPPS
jgi:HEAT repeat protein